MLFTRPEAWFGGAYELMVHLGSQSDEVRLTTLRTMWTAPGVYGCFLDRDREPADQERVAPSQLTLSHAEGRVHGVATFPDGRTTTCYSLGPLGDGADHWLYFGLPLGSLAQLYPIGAYPLDDGTPLDWRIHVDEWLCRVARALWQTCPFRIATTGASSAGAPDARSFERTGVPAERWEGYLIPRGADLQWHPPNRGAPLGPDRGDKHTV